MSLTNPNTVVTEQRLSDFYKGILPYLGGMPEMLANKFSKGDLYSTEEKMIGQWVDGKPLYQKTVLASFATTITEGTETSNITSSGLSNIDVAFISEIFVNNSTWGSIINPNDMWSANSSPVSVVRCQLKNTNGTLTIETISNRNVYSGKNAYVTIKYTKSTDSAISIGDANDYSTEEKIIGTWIDGKPLYQKTLTGSYGQNTNFDLNITNADKVIIKRAGIILSTGEYIPHGAYTNVDNYLSFFITSDKARCGVRSSPSYYNSTYYVTIQYTKTT